MNKEFKKNLSIIGNKLSKLRGVKYGKGETTNIDLDMLGKFFIGIRYMGTYSQDNVDWKKIGQYDRTYFIINVDTKEMGGSHWIAIMKSNNNLYIFDSFGRKTMNLLPIFKKQAEAKGYRIIDTEYDKDQKIAQLDCGIRCISALMIGKKFGVRSYKSL